VLVASHMLYYTSVDGVRVFHEMCVLFCVLFEMLSLNLEMRCCLRGGKPACFSPRPSFKSTRM
jgi:hypothetical protein